MNKIKIMCRYKKNFYLVFLMVLLIISKVNTQEKNLRFVVAGHLYPIINDLEKINKFAKKINTYKPDYVFILGDSNLQDKQSFDYLKTDENKNYFLNLVYNKNIILHAVEYHKRIVAAHIGYVSHDIFSYTFPVHDDNFKFQGFGIYLLNFIVQECFQKKIKTFDFGIGYQLYKKQWSNVREEVFFNSIHANIKGFLLSKLILTFYKSIRIKNFLKKIY